MMEKKISKKSILSEWKSREKKESAKSALRKAPEGVDFPLSSGQQRLFFLDRLYPDNPVYNSSEIYTIKGPINIDGLEAALQAVFKTNDVYSCSFHLVNGKAVQKINSEVSFNISYYDLSNLSEKKKKEHKEEIMHEDSLKPFNLDNPPLIRASILKMTNEVHILFITVHHIITDKWSISLFQEQLAKFYKKLPTSQEIEASKNRLQFTDYAYWKQEHGVPQGQLEYWKKKLSGDIPVLELPTDYPQPVTPSFQGGSNVSKLSRDLSERVITLSRELDTTPYVLLLSVYYVMLHKYSDQNDILVGSPISVRGSKALENIIGFFDETIVLRASIGSKLPFRDFVKEVRMLVMNAFNNKEVPFDALVKELKPNRLTSGNPFFRTMFIYHSVTDKPFFDSDIEFSYDFYNTGISKFDLTLYISNEDGHLSTEFEYAKDLFKDTSIDRFQEHLKLLLEGITQDSSMRIDEIPMLTTKEINSLGPYSSSSRTPFEDWNAIHEIILQHVRKTPSHTALVFENDSLTYKELGEESDVVAQQILKFSKGKNQIVGLCVNRSLQMVVGLLGILKSGCAYLPIDLNYPSKRIAYILDDSSVEILLTQKGLESNFEGFKGERLLIDEQKVDNDAQRVELPTVGKNDLAYVIYTSGSTGRPKGVPITHGNIISSTGARLDFYPENPSSFLLMSSISFDSSKAGLFWTLSTGGTLVISSERLEQDIQKLSNTISKNSVTHTLMLPSLYKILLEYGEVKNLMSLRAVMVAGEECKPSLCYEHFEQLPNTELYNEYGPTEATVWCIAHKIEKNTNDTVVPIGKAISNAEVYLLNKSRQLIPSGAIGEIYVGGSGLAGSYLNRPELTKESYIKHPFNKDKDALLYKTGDLGRRRNDGAIEFLGRTDDQVKIRGFRIELNEIEKALLKNESVREALVMAESVKGKNNADATKRLVAYVVSKDPIDTKALQRNLITQIPSYMIPNSIIDIDKFPELPNGKIDKKALQEFGEAIRSKSAIHVNRPSNDIESNLLDIWEEVLDHSNISVTDNYFEIGGDSMTSIKMFWLIENKMNIKLSPGVLFNYPTIQDIARKITSDRIKVTQEMKYVVPYRIAGSKHPLFCVHGGEGHILFYQNFANYLDMDRPVYFVQPKGADGDKELHNSIEEMAEAYLEEILQIQKNGPYNLTFYCCGPLVIEISNRLKELGKQANMIIIDTSPNHVIEDDQPNHDSRYKTFFKRIINNPVRTIKKSLIYRYRRYVVPMYASFIKDDFVKRHIDIRTRLEDVQREYEWKEFDAKCTLILGQDGLSEFDESDINGWNFWCSSEVNVIYNPGNHFNIFDQPHVKSLGKTVEKVCL